MRAPAMARTANATTTNTPATLPGFEKKSDFLVACVRAVSAGGAVGVMVKVLIRPVTVMTDVTGVGDHDVVDDGGAESVAEVVD